VHEAGNAILLRGGACADELRLMVVEVGFRCTMVCVLVVLSFCGVNSRLREGFFWCVCLGLRLYLFLLVGGVWWSILFIPTSIFIVLVVCSAGFAM
jgi:hypothetical protein